MAATKCSRGASLGSRAVMRLAAITACAAALFCLLLGSMTAEPAFASSELSVGQYSALAGVPNSSEYDDDLLSLKAKSSNPSVVSCSAKRPEGYVGKRELFAFARGFGEATVTVSWTLRESSYNEKTGKVTQTKQRHSKSFEFSVKEAVVKKSCCDHIFTGKDYAVASLFKGARSANHVSMLPRQGKGSFIAGQGYSVSANGKKVRFDKQGEGLTVGYRVDSSVHPIYIAVVHSQESLSNKVIAAVKKLCYYPSSLKVKSVSLRNSKLYVSFSAVNLAGVRNNSRVCAYFDHGSFKFEKLS